MGQTWKQGGQRNALATERSTRHTLVAAGTTPTAIPLRLTHFFLRFFSAFLWKATRRRFLFTWRSVSLFFLPS